MLMGYIKTIFLSNAWYSVSLQKNNKETHMSESMIEKYNTIGKNWNVYTKQMEEIADLYNPLNEEVYKNGFIDSKYKRMMAIVGALVSGCTACILFQTEEALNAGATTDEILEACAVAMALGGSMAGGQTTKVVAYLSEKGLIEE